MRLVSFLFSLHHPTVRGVCEAEQQTHDSNSMFSPGARFRRWEFCPLLQVWVPWESES